MSALEKKKKKKSLRGFELFQCSLYILSHDHTGRVGVIRLLVAYVIKLSRSVQTPGTGHDILPSRKVPESNVWRKVPESGDAARSVRSLVEWACLDGSTPAITQ